MSNKKSEHYKMGSIFKQVTGMDHIPDTTKEIDEAVKNSVGIKEELNGKRYEIFPIKKHPTPKEIEKSIDKKLRKL